VDNLCRQYYVNALTYVKCVQLCTCELLASDLQNYFYFCSVIFAIYE